MSTKDKIIRLGRDLIQVKGVNGFSFADIAQALDIKKASIHYYFPSKMDLVEAVVEQFSIDFFATLEHSRAENRREWLETYITIYRRNLEVGKICLCSDLAMDTHHLNAAINQKIGHFFEKNIQWLTEQIGDQASAEDFYASIQGAQLISRNQGRTDYFDQVMTRKLDLLV